MNWDKLEKFVRNNRQELDKHEPDEMIWAKIEAGLAETRPNKSFIYWRIAAILFFVISLGLLFKNYQANNEIKAIADNSEFRNTEAYYLKVINDKEDLLISIATNYPSLESDFKNDLDELTKSYNSLKADYENSGNEEVLFALIKNLQLRQELLDNQLKIIQTIKEEKENVSI